MPGELLPCADVPLDDGHDGVVYAHPAIHYAVVPSSVCLDKVAMTNLTKFGILFYTSFIVGKSNPSPRNDFATSLFSILIVNLTVGRD